jgi:aminotransferase
MLADVASLGFPGAREAADALLAESKVASIPGTAFYASRGGDQLLRFCFAKDFEPLEQACRQIRQFRSASVRS